MLFSNIDILNENFEYERNKYVAVTDKTITYIGSEKPAEYDGEIYNGQGKLLMPGLVNTHTHMAMSMLRGYAENLPLNDWLFTRIFPFEDKMKLNRNNMYIGPMLSIAEALKFGTTSFTDMYFYTDELFRAIEETGIKCNAGNSVSCFDDSDYYDLNAFKENSELIKCHNGADGRFKVDLCVHSEYTTTQKVVEQMADEAKKYNLNIQVHLSETKSEHEECKARHGKTPAKYLADCGVFDSKTTAAHCVWLEDEDFDILHNKKVNIAVNTASNLKLGSGIPDISKMIEKGINVTIGTDSVASNNNLNMFKEMYLFATLPKGSRLDPTIVSPKETLMAATVNGAVSQGRYDCGTIKVGNKADLIVLDTDKPYMYPQTDMLNNIVYSAQGTDVVLTMVDGKVLYKDDEYMTLDIEKVKYEVGKAKEDILKLL